MGGFLRVASDRIGSHVLATDLLCVDTGFLSSSALAQRPRTRVRDGGPSNTGDLRSCTIALRSERLPGLPGLGYQLGFSRQEAGRGGRDERGWVAGASYEFPIGDPANRLAAKLLAEYAHLHGAGGEPQDDSYLTCGAALHRGEWQAALSWTRRAIRPHGGAGLGGGDDSLTQVTLGYASRYGFAIAAAWYREHEGEVTLRGIGVRLTYTAEF